MLQKRALRFICNNELMYNTFYFKYNNLKFYDIVKLNTVKFMFRARNYSIPLNLQNLFKIKYYDNILFHKNKDAKKICLYIQYETTVME